MIRDEENSKQILTVPEEITDHQPFLLTGNEYVSLPRITAGSKIESLNVLRLDHRGMIEFTGNTEEPLLQPFLTIDADDFSLNEIMNSGYDYDWLPFFTSNLENGSTLKVKIFAPPGLKGFCGELILVNGSKNPVDATLGWRGCFSGLNYHVFKGRAVDGKLEMRYDRWTKSLVMEASTGLPLAALALAVEPGEAKWIFDSETRRFTATINRKLEPGEEVKVSLYAALNLEASGATTGTVDLRRQGTDTLHALTISRLESLRSAASVEDSELTALLHKNLFFCYYFSLGRSLDGEELVALTSRSPRYYVSCAFWSRDTLLWSFPAIVMADAQTARELLLTVFKRHLRNAGDHAHYIDGTILYPGFELDQLAAYFLALAHYTRESGDESLIEETTVGAGLDILVDKALDRFDPHSGLYATFLDPSDDPAPFPFLTYNNALLQRAFYFLAELQGAERWQHKSDFATLSAELRQAIYEHCTIKGPQGPMFAWAVDGKGKFCLYDNPPGSLQLLAHYGFCSVEDIVFLNTVRWIRSTHNRYYHQGRNFEEASSRHAENPWPMAACNDLLACNIGGVDFLRRAALDKGFFCETIDPDTGLVSTGAAFASGAGFLAYALSKMNSGGKCSQRGSASSER